VTVRAKDVRHDPLTTQVYVPAEVSCAGRERTLAPAPEAITDPFAARTDTVSEAHLLNDSAALAAPAPAVTLKLSDDVLAVRAPEKDVVLVPLVTAAVAEEVAVDEPAPFEAVTATFTVAPTSEDVRTYEEADAPAMPTHPPPTPSQRCHWKA